ncbi:MAG: hypothetical protein ACRDRT_17665, partial [Pseudonocardiaceae bacterium]
VGGTGDAARIFPVTIPRGENFPAIAFRRAARSEDQTFRRVTGIPRELLELTTWAKTYRQAKAIAKVMRQQVNNFDRQQGPWGTVDVENCLLTDEEDIADVETYPGEILFGVRQEYTVDFQEACWTRAPVTKSQPASTTPMAQAVRNAWSRARRSISRRCRRRNKLLSRLRSRG